MKTNRSLKRLGALALAGFLVGLAGFLLLSEKAFVDTRATIAAAPAEIFAFFNSRADHQQLWTRGWERLGQGRYPMNIADLGGPAEGRGMKLGFFPGGTDLGSFDTVVNSFARGDGEIVESTLNRRVVFEIDFGLVRSRRTITLEPVDEAHTDVAWSERLRADNPFARYLLFFASGEAAQGFDQLLAALEDLT